MSDYNPLPDSRLKDDTLGTVMVDWEFHEIVDGVMTFRTQRLEMQPIYCVSCGKPEGWIPKGIMTWVCFICDPCSEKHGHTLALMDCPDTEFWDKVREEIHKAYGRGLTQRELAYLVDQGKLSRALQILERESPFRGKS